jgi:hypothetical protein
LNNIENVIPDSVWKVISEDKGYWRVGVYRPEFLSPDDITVLEKHSCPEFFICVGGKGGLILCKDGKETQEILEEFQSILVEDFHNGFRIDSSAFFLVAERSSFETEYMERNSGKIIKRVKV